MKLEFISFILNKIKLITRLTRRVRYGTNVSVRGGLYVAWLLRTNLRVSLNKSF